MKNISINVSSWFTSQNYPIDGYGLQFVMIIFDRVSSRWLVDDCDDFEILNIRFFFRNLEPVSAIFRFFVRSSSLTHLSYCSITFFSTTQHNDFLLLPHNDSFYLAYETAAESKLKQTAENNILSLAKLSERAYFCNFSLVCECHSQLCWKHNLIPREFESKNLKHIESMLTKLQHIHISMLWKEIHFLEREKPIVIRRWFMQLFDGCSCPWTLNTFADGSKMSKTANVKGLKRKMLSMDSYLFLLFVIMRSPLTNKLIKNK